MYYFTVNYSTIYYSTTTPAVCISETDLRRFTQDFTILLFCYFTISVLYYSTMYYFTVNYSTIYYSTTTPAVCISETDLRRFSQDFTIFTILLFQYCTILLCTILLLTIPLCTILPRPQSFASRKPTCAGSPKILLFYYFAILLFQYCTILLCTILLLTIPIFTIPPRPQPFASRKPTCAGSPRILLFYYFSIVLFYYVCTILLLTIPLFAILPRPRPFASRKPTCAGSPRILLFYYFTTILPRPPPFASRKPTCAGSPRILIFYYFAILLFQYCTILLCTILLLTIPIFTILPRPQPFAYRKPTCAGSPRILLFCNFTISVLYYSTMYYFTVNYSTICYSTTTPAVCISETDLRRFTQHFTILLPRPQPFGYFTILLYHDPSRLHLANPPLHVVP